ncbi:MAG: hypothetical protein OES38_00895, partial [Gammaproteobacteria bacterium]|nr:hypothetical protein [Gammaproteobacteria bacterium]
DQDRDTIDALGAIKTTCSTVPLVLIVDQPSTDLVISAFRGGASDVIDGALDAGSLKRCLDRVGVTAVDQDTLAQSKVGQTYPATTTSKSRASSDSVSHGPTDATRDGGRNPLDANSTPMLGMHCFGSFRVFLNQQQIRKPLSRKGRAILVYLALHGQQPAHRDVLMEEFWPNSTPESARNCLNFTLHGIRERFREIDRPHDWILYQDAHYFLNPDFEIWSDVGEFLRVWQAGAKVEAEKGLAQAVPHYERASELYQGDFMEEERYVSWPSLERDKLREIYLVILDKLSNCYYSEGRQSAAVSICKTILQIDGPREDVHRRLMACYYELGDRDKALRQFLRCKTVLEAEFDVEPTRSTLELAQQIKNESFDLRN